MLGTSFFRLTIIDFNGILGYYIQHTSQLGRLVQISMNTSLDIFYDAT